MALLEPSKLAREVPALQGVFVAALPDGLLFDAWVREDETWDAEDVAVEVGALAPAVRKALWALGVLSSAIQLTVESDRLTVVTRELQDDVVVVFVFDRALPLGLVRHHVDRILSQIPRPVTGPETGMPDAIKIRGDG